MVLRPLEELIISNPNAYDLLNNVEVGNYNQKHYIKKRGLHIDYTLEDDLSEDEPENAPTQAE